MSMTRLKRYSMPGYWPVGRKERKWVASPIPGPHKKELCIPLQMVVKNMLGLAETSGEAKKLIKSGKIMVDGKARKEQNYPVGFMDVVGVEEIRKYYRVLLSKNGLFLEEIKHTEADKKVCKIIKKTTIKRNVQQLNLHDGRNILVKSAQRRNTNSTEIGDNTNAQRRNTKSAEIGGISNSDGQYKVGDSVLIQLPEQNILNHYRLQKGNSVIILKGKNAGANGEIKEIYNRKTMTEKSTIIIKTGTGSVETLKEYVIVISGKGE